MNTCVTHITSLMRNIEDQMSLLVWVIQQVTPHLVYWERVVDIWDTEPVSESSFLSSETYETFLIKFLVILAYLSFCDIFWCSVF